MIKLGTLVKCTWTDEHPNLLGIIISMTGIINGGTADSWAEIHWTDGRTTWEEWEASLGECFEVINESR